MTGQDPYPDPNGDAGDAARVRNDIGPAPSTPRWVKALMITALLLILLFLILHLAGLSPTGHGS